MIRFTLAYFRREGEEMILGRDGTLSPIQMIIVHGILRQEQARKKCEDFSYFPNDVMIEEPIEATIDNLKYLTNVLDMTPDDSEKLDKIFQKEFYELLTSGGVKIEEGICVIDHKSTVGQLIVDLAHNHPLYRFIRCLQHNPDEQEGE